MPHLGERWASEGRCWEAGPQQVRPSEDPSPSLLLGLGRQGGGPANQLSPSFEAPPAPLCRNHKIPVQRQEMGLFLALCGKKKTNASLLFKNIWCVCWAGGELGGAQSLCWQGGGPAPRPCGAAILHGSLAHTATLGSYCFLARPERNGILIKTNSSCQNKGEEPASCSHLDACFPLPWLRGGGWVVMRSILGTSLRRRASPPCENGWRPWVPLWVSLAKGIPGPLCYPSRPNPESHGSAKTQGRLDGWISGPPGIQFGRETR